MRPLFVQQNAWDRGIRGVHLALAMGNAPKSDPRGLQSRGSSQGRLLGIPASVRRGAGMPQPRQCEAETSIST